MAQKVQVILVDDLTGGSADETILFGLDGVNYEIDLNSQNAEKLRSALEQYVDAARKVSRAPRGARKARVVQDGPSANEIRDWARVNGYAVNVRGRVPQDVRDAYEAAH